MTHAWGQWAYWGLLAVVVSMSTYLAQDFARSSRRRLLVEAENERRGHELGLARSLQLSMLPQEYPALPHLELGWRMQPASEVGGDYYDYHLAADGALTLALGAATGHGMQAGILVAAVKGLFQALARQPDLAAVLEIISASLRRMHLGRLGMALVLLRIEGKEYQAASRIGGHYIPLPRLGWRPYSCNEHSSEQGFSCLPWMRDARRAAGRS